MCIRDSFTTVHEFFIPIQKALDIDNRINQEERYKEIIIMLWQSQRKTLTGSMNKIEQYLMRERSLKENSEIDATLYGMTIY